MIPGVGVEPRRCTVRQKARQLGIEKDAEIGKITWK
jgi:hypothetical protein